MQGKVYVGIDVSKAKLNVCVESGGEFEVRNRASAIRQALGRLSRGHGDIHVCFESTGVYGRMLLECCHGQGVCASQLNAKRAHKWAEGRGYIAKTDRLDARMLCRLGRETGPSPTRLPEPWKREMRDLCDRRDILVGEKARLDGRLEQAFSAPASKMIRREIRRLGGKIKGLDGMMESLFRANDPSLLSRMTSVRCVGAVTACLVVAALPEAGTLGGKAAAMLAGVAPHTRESGTAKGAGHIEDGRKGVRNALYMPAVAGIRHNPILRAFYRKKRKEGKPARVAIVAVMRKLVVLLERIASDPSFVPSNGSPPSSPPSSAPLHPSPQPALSSP